MKVDFLTKYAPKTYTDLIVPKLYKTIVKDLFTGNLNLSDKGYVITGDYGTGKTALVNLLKKTTQWPCFTIPDRAKASGDTIKSIKEWFYNNQGPITSLFNDEPLVRPVRLIIECHEISSSTTDFRLSLSNVVDEFYDHAVDNLSNNKLCNPALWLFTDNHLSNLLKESERTFRSGRIKPLDWTKITKEQVSEYVKQILEKEGLDTDRNNFLVAGMLKDNKGVGIREVLTDMSKTIE